METMAIKAAVIGAAGFAGVECTRILLRHPSFELVVITSDALAGKRLSEVYPAFTGCTDLAFQTNDEAANKLAACDVAFLAVPHTAAMAMVPALLAQGVSVIDLSADFRLKNAAVYEQWYGVPHTSPELLAKAAFGLPELTGQELAQAAQVYKEGNPVLVACAGCYPTATSLAAAPIIKTGMVDDSAIVVVDAISGVTGAGKKATERTHFCFANENLEAYGVASHRHTPEIEQILGIKGRLVFTPHLAPLNRGLLSTVTLQLDASVPMPSIEELAALYVDYYAKNPLVTVLPAGQMPRTASVTGTCRAHIGAAPNVAAHAIVAVGAIDNLGKGAAGQAVQCANIVFGLKEDEGLNSVAEPV